MTLEEDIKKLDQRVKELEYDKDLGPIQNAPSFNHYASNDEYTSAAGGCCIIGAAILGVGTLIGFLV